MTRKDRGRNLERGGRAKRRHRFSKASKLTKAAWHFASRRSPNIYDPRRVASSLAQPGARGRRSAAGSRRAGDRAVRCLTRSNALSGLARDDSRSRHAEAPAVRPIFCLQRGLVPRTAGDATAGRRRQRRGTVPDRRRDGGRLKLCGAGWQPAESQIDNLRYDLTTRWCNKTMETEFQVFTDKPPEISAGGGTPVPA